MKVKLFTPPLFLGIFLVLLLFSCTNDELENNSTNPVINQLKNDLKLDQFTNKNISQNLVVNWETLSRIEKDGDPIKARILNRYRTESSGRSVEVNTTLQQNLIGKPCN